MNDTLEVTIYHNPSCGTSRSTLALLEEHNVPHKVVKYMDIELSQSDYESFLDMIPDEPTMLVRRDNRFKELGISEGRGADPQPGAADAGQAPRADAASHRGQGRPSHHLASG